MKLPELFKNKYVLYIVLFLAITNIVGYLHVENYNAIVLFIACGYLSTFFSKNMIINLLVPLVVTNLVFATKSGIEGMKNKNCEKCKKCKKCVNGLCEDDGCEKCECSEGMETKENKKKNEKNTQNKKDKKNGFANKKLSPSPATESEEDEVEGNGKHIDYSATLEQAYDNLQNIIGDGGMQNLTKDTKDLIKQQKSLMKTMESMAPILKNANNILGGLDMSQMNNAMGSLSSLMGKVGLSGK